MKYIRLDGVIFANYQQPGNVAISNYTRGVLPAKTMTPTHVAGILTRASWCVY